MKSRLEARVVSRPDDASGWRLLGRIYLKMANVETTMISYGNSKNNKTLTLSGKIEIDERNISKIPAIIWEE